MRIVEVASQNTFPVEILPLENDDKTSKKRYFFDWKEEAGYEVYKLVHAGTNDILGLMSLERIPQEWRIHIRLLTVSVENRGVAKKFDKIAGNLISFAARIALEEYGVLACVSLRPKTEIVAHYVSKYQMKVAGMSLSLEVPELLDLINAYE
jgi:hypothetical protein